MPYSWYIASMSVSSSPNRRPINFQRVAAPIVFSTHSLKFQVAVVDELTVASSTVGMYSCAGCWGSANSFAGLDCCLRVGTVCDCSEVCSLVLIVGRVMRGCGCWSSGVCPLGRDLTEAGVPTADPLGEVLGL